MRVLVVEDTASLAEHLRDALRQAGYAVDCTGDGSHADFLVRTEALDAVLLDLGLPVVDGLTLLRRWRADGIAVPVIVLSARGTWSERVQGIDTGADDYLGKPFETGEVLSRLRAIIRRSYGHAQPELRSGCITLDPRRSVVTVADRVVSLSAHEYRTLWYLMHHAGRVVPQAELIEHIYGEALDPDSNTVEVFISRLRRKLGAAAIETVRGIGYRVPPSTSGPQVST